MPSLRLRLLLFADNKCLIPADRRLTRPVAVTLNRLATDFRVLALISIRYRKKERAV